MCTGLNSTSGRILIVDDEAHVREVVRRSLRREGYSCETANDTDAAWAHLQTQDVDLLTLDVTMPGETGIKFLSRVRAAFPELAVIMLTGVRDTDTVIQAITHDVSAFLTKPVDAKELVFHVTRGLERCELLRERQLHTDQLESRVREQTATIRHAYEDTIHRLVKASMYRDEETGAHIKRVGLTSARLAESIGWSAERVDQIRLAAPMHDVGKIGIPDRVLQKPGRLTPEELAIMKSHAVIGACVLAGSESPMLQMACEIALSHHERWDGSGYPTGLVGEDTPQAGRIVAIADVYDALTHDRVYRPAIEEPRVLAMMQADRGTHFDPQLLDLFMAILPDVRSIAEQNPDGIEAVDRKRSLSPMPNCPAPGTVASSPLAMV